MKVLLLAAGYATRLYPLTLNKPKSLLPIAGRTVIDFILHIIGPLKDVDEIFVVTNQKFFKDFEKWSVKSRSFKKIVIVNDGTTTDENKIGATGDIEFVIREMKIKDDLLVLAGDNIFQAGLGGFIDFAILKKPSICIGLYDVHDLVLAKKYGIVSLDEDRRVLEFKEKPSSPASTLASKCLYFFPKEKLGIVHENLVNDTLKDAPGYFLERVVKKESVFGYVFEGERWFDIGDVISYEEAKKAFKNKEV